MTGFTDAQNKLAEDVKFLLTNDARRAVSVAEIRAVLAMFDAEKVRSLPEEHIPQFRKWVAARFDCATMLEVLG